VRVASFNMNRIKALFKPISHLITIPLLYRAFKKAVGDFIGDDTDKTGKLHAISIHI